MPLWVYAYIISDFLKISFAFQFSFPLVHQAVLNRCLIAFCDSSVPRNLSDVRCFHTSYIKSACAFTFKPTLYRTISKKYLPLQTWRTVGKRQEGSTSQTWQQNELLFLLVYQLVAFYLRLFTCLESSFSLFVLLQLRRLFRMHMYVCIHYLYELHLIISWPDQNY